MSLFAGAKPSNGLHNATVLSGECAFAQAASEGTTVSLFAGAKPSNGLHNATVLSGECAFCALVVYVRIYLRFSGLAQRVLAVAIYYGVP